MYEENTFELYAYLFLGWALNHQSNSDEFCPRVGGQNYQGEWLVN